LGHEGEPHWVGSVNWTKSNPTSEIGHHIFTKNLKTLGLWILSRICCSTSTLYQMRDLNLHLASLSLSLSLSLHKVEMGFETTVEGSPLCKIITLG